MPDAQPRHTTPDPGAGARATRTVRFWALPVAVTLAVLAALAGLYLGGIVNPMSNLRHFPIAVVNEDAGPAGAQIVRGLSAGVDKNKFDLRSLSHQEALHQMDTAQIYGEAVIPRDFSAKLQTIAESLIRPGEANRPTIVITTNPRAGTMGASIARQTLTEAVAAVNTNVGQRLSARVAQQIQGPLAGAMSLALASPIQVQNIVHNPLPEGTGNGLSAFYYSLLLLLAGFTGSIVVSMLVDSMLGYVPAEFGPVYRFAEQVDISRFRTLLVKWALMAGLAFLVSMVYMAIANGFGMPLPHSWTLWLYGAFAIIAVGVTSTSLIAVLGSIGLLASMFVFVILGLPSAGATVPLQATPPFFSWLATFEPMHQVFLGARALLYLDGHADAGLSQSLILTTVGLVIGLGLGAVVTRIYDRRGYHRIAGTLGTTRTQRTRTASG